MKVFIITEGSKEIGFGHITRCMSLYQAFEEKNIFPQFIVNVDESLNQFLEGKRYNRLNWTGKTKELFKLIENADIAIVDSYLADYNIYKKISELVKIPVYIDDNKRIDYPRGTVVNGSIYARFLDYPQKDSVKYLLGPDFIMLRQEFWNASKKNTSDDLKDILITFGGDDSRNITPKVLNLLNNRYPELNKIIIVGSAFQNVEEIEKLKTNKTELIYNPGSKEMKENMLKSDIAISAGGQTLYELSKIGIPIIAIAVASNQINNVNYCKQAGLIEYAGFWNDKKLLDTIFKSFEALKDINLRLEMSNVGKNTVKGNGPIKIVEYCIKMLHEPKLITMGEEYGI